MTPWLLTIDLKDVFHNEDLPFEQKRDEIVRRIRATGWHGDHPWLEEIVDNLAESEDENDFDSWWDELYDVADIDRVWIATF